MAKMTGNKKNSKVATAKARKKVTAQTTKAAPQRVKWEDNATIKVVGDHSRREGSRYHDGYEQMRKARTVGAFRKLREKNGDAQELLRAAIKDEFIANIKS